MTLKKSRYWYVPLSELQNESGTNLRSASSSVLESDRLVKEGDAFTISLESFYVREKLEDSGNDLDDVRRKEHFKFLQDTIRSANDMKDLDYFYRLRIKQKLGEELSESQRKRFLEIAEKLQKYIPDL